MDGPLLYLNAPFDQLYPLRTRYMAYIMDTNEEERVKVYIFCF